MFQCVSDSRTLSADVLRRIEKGPEMVEPVRPLRNSSPLIFRHHSYTHISVDPSHNSNAQVLFLSLREYRSSTGGRGGWGRRWRGGEVERWRPLPLGISPQMLAPALGLHLHVAMVKLLVWVEARYCSADVLWTRTHLSVWNRWCLSHARHSKATPPAGRRSGGCCSRCFWCFWCF